MDKETESLTKSPEEIRPATKSRRQFTRSAVIGSAVLFTVGNRAAWGGGRGKSPVCLSAVTMASMTNYGSGLQASMSPLTQEAIADYERASRRDDMVKVRGEDINEDHGSVCLIKEGKVPKNVRPIY